MVYKCGGKKNISYEGSWDDGLKSGFGVIEYINGDMYSGGFKDDVRNGNGEYIYLNKGYPGKISKIQCLFVNDQTNGNGKIWYNNGDEFEGEIIEENKSSYGF